MSKIEKLVQKFLTIPTDLTWEEFSKVLNHYGYIELKKKGETGGSRRKFINKMKPHDVIIAHKPHLQNVVKNILWNKLSKTKFEMKNYLEYKGYLGTARFSADDKVFCGKIQGINDLILFEGESVSELENSFKESVDDYLETCKEIGREPNKNFQRKFQCAGE